MYICIQLLYSNKSMYIKRNIDDDDNKECDDINIHTTKISMANFRLTFFTTKSNTNSLKTIKKEDSLIYSNTYFKTLLPDSKY